MDSIIYSTTNCVDCIRDIHGFDNIFNVTFKLSSIDIPKPLACNSYVYSLYFVAFPKHVYTRHLFSIHFKAFAFN